MSSVDPGGLPIPERGDDPAEMATGASRTDEFTVEGQLLTDVGGTLGAAVLDGRKLHFDVEVREGERTIGVGTHQRRVIPTATDG